MRFCKNCGAQLMDNARFCGKCGTSFASDEPAQDAMATEAEKEIPVYQETRPYEQDAAYDAPMQAPVFAPPQYAAPAMQPKRYHWPEAFRALSLILAVLSIASCLTTCVYLIQYLDFGTRGVRIVLQFALNMGELLAAILLLVGSFTWRDRRGARLLLPIGLLAYIAFTFAWRVNYAISSNYFGGRYATSYQQINYILVMLACLLVLVGVIGMLINKPKLSRIFGIIALALLALGLILESVPIDGIYYQFSYDSFTQTFMNNLSNAIELIVLALIPLYFGCRKEIK